MERINDENVRKLAMTVAEQIRQRGIKEGEKIGIAKAKRDIYVRMIKRRFGFVSPELEERFRKADIDVLDEFGEALFDFEKFEDVEKWWRKR